jgi:hypothetical protein
MAGRPRTRAKRAANGGIAYTSALAESVCELVSDGHGLQTISEMPGFPTRRTIRRWIAEHADFRAMYETARVERAEALFEDLERLASTGPQVVAAAQAAGINENAAVAAWKTELAARQWALSKIAPARYADKLAVEASGPGGAPLLQPEPDIPRVAAMMRAIIEAGRPQRTLDEILPPQPSLPSPDPEAEERRLEALRTGHPVPAQRPGLGAVDEPELPMGDFPAPRRPPSLIDLKDEREARRAYEKIAPFTRSYP